MVAALGFATIITFLALTFTRRVSVLVALVLVPIGFALIGGFGADLGDMIAEGLIKVAPVAIMIAFAVLYFSLMVDQGLFDPAIRRVVRWAGGSPTKIAVGTAVLTLMVALDGDGTSTFLIMVSAMLPIYQRIGMRPLALTGIIALSAGIMNIIPWGGPTVRAMAALDATSADIFTPVIPAMAAGIVWVLFSAFMIGRMESKRIGALTETVTPVNAGPGTPHVDDLPVRTTVHPAVMAFNVVLTLVLLVILLFQLAPLQVAFAIAFALAVLVNKPRWSAQQELFAKHGGNVTMVVVMILAAGVLTGVLNGTGMITAMAETFVSWIPDSFGSSIPVITAITSMPLSLVFTPDAYYFGVLPVLAETTASFGGDPMETGRAAILGQMTTGFPLSPLTAATFVLIGMTKVELGKHQRFIFGWAFGTTLVMTAMALLTGAISL
ncbi:MULTISPECIES: CitMHS family transporter [Nocardiaceae]|uniref:CitMHS family citrate-Mg2+:H+ or citrate-Ca2+:H+ symporter n=1 Tax=Rhodococcoides corynebacterioides TaxID=53972 RepID=A0ABS2KVC3_9NOCA|nr:MULTISPECIES: citrate:proton symporter [Rhodococcus]MBM7415884.1 CitMHS family citrate-Mg2+:H+ or citrate-Ca2+:H+ symporter [Rhodococcus corynebacterioides]MBP1118346.1 CitMHS family citrate-Mg2+:H+ or citrate-Ca2+:H+ symporter [Rhodococcus sp. PvP016]